MVKSSVFILAACLCVRLNDASLCKPLSTFLIDCNSCTCSKNGMEYSCSDYVCPPKYHEKYDMKITKDGYKLLVPKNSNQYTLDDDEFILTKKRRVPRIPEGYPYINDEIPSSKELDNNIYERENNDIDERDNNDIDERDNNVIGERANKGIDENANDDTQRRNYKRYNNNIDEMKTNDLTFEEDDNNEDTEWMGEDEDESDDDSDEDTGNENTASNWRKIIPSARERV